MSKRYSVYDRRTDMPVVIYGTSQECADAMKIDRHSFYSYIMLSRKGRQGKKYEIFEDEEEELE